MSKSWSFLIVASAIVVLSQIPASAQETGGTGDILGAVHTGLITGGPVPAGFGDNIHSCTTCPKLYDNSTICTVSVQAIALGGQPANPMSPRDWFVTPGGNVTGFDLFLLNGAPNNQSLTVQFYAGTSSQVLGDADPNAFFRTQGAPLISAIPPWDDPITGRPGIIRVSVDYAAETYTLTGLSEDPITGGTVETPLNGGGEVLGTGIGRLPFSLPSGKVGVGVRLGNELSICNGGDPKAGPVLASGGSGSEDGLHMIGIYSTFGNANCAPFEYPEICDDAGWAPFTNVSCNDDADCEAVFGAGATCLGTNICDQQASVPCTGGDVCNLDRPFFGIAMTLYAGPGEDEDGNNQISTADTIAAPAAGSGEIVSVTGFVGDNGTPCDCSSPNCDCTTLILFDHDADNDVDLLDWGDFQRCFGQTDDPSCALHDQNSDGVIDLSDFGNTGVTGDFDDCFTRDASDPNHTPVDCSIDIPPAAVQLEDVDVFEISGVTPGHVVEILLEGTKSSTEGPLWDPFLRVFDGSGQQIPIRDGIGGESDDFERSSFDAYTTVEVPPGSNSLFVGVSTSGQVLKLSAPACLEDGDCVAAGVGVCLGGDSDGSFCSSTANCPGCDDGMGGVIDCPCVGTCGGLAEGRCDLPCNEDADCASIIGFPPTATCGQLDAGFCDNRVWYDPNDTSTIMPLQEGSDAGGYTLSVAVTDPNAVIDNGTGGQFDCNETRHEPDDTLEDATTQGAITSTILVAAIGDGAFAGLGQDVDIWRIELDDDPLSQTANTRSFTAQVKDVAGFGFQTAFDLVLAVYDADGELIATGDQSPRGGSFDQTRPQLGVNVCGSALSPPLCQNESSTPGLYYLAVFGTDRQQFDDAGDPLSVAIPPTLLNFPHGLDVAATAFADLRPVVGGRVNIPGDRIVGRVPQEPNVPPNGPELQCYRIVVSTFQSNLPPTGSDVDESAENGNDSIRDASTGTLDMIISDRLASDAIVVRTLGNGRFGGNQGDVDFYQIGNAGPGDLVSLNIADNMPPGTTDNRVRSFVALYDQDGFIIAAEDYTLEHYDPNIFIADNISDEIAANVASLIPQFTGGGNVLTTVYAMIGIDNGNLLLRENTPFDAVFPGTTLSRRFQTNVQTPRTYRISASILNPLPASMGVSERVFAVVRRGRDGIHTEPFTSSPTQSRSTSFPPLVELNPNTGEVIKLLDGTQGATNFFTFRSPFDECQMNPDGCEQEVSANPIIAYDGDVLYVSVEECNAGQTSCPNVSHPLFKIDPDLTPDDTGFIGTFGEISLDDPGFDAALTGMVEINGFLYALDTTSDRVRFWDKTLQPTANNGGQTAVDELLNLSGTAGEGTDFDDLDGDLATNGVSIYVPCFLNGNSVGICQFTPTLMPDGSDATFVFDGIIADPITNELLSPGPRLGGLEILSGGLLMATDTNGPIIEYFDPSADTVNAVELPREFLVERVTARNAAP